MDRLLILLSLVLATAWAQELVSLGDSDWKYEDSGTDLGTAWRTVDFDDSAWSSGSAPLGFNSDIVVTTLTQGPATSVYPTYYLRKEVNLVAGGMFAFTVNIQVDDGAIVYINNIEVGRANMPGGEVTFDTLASATRSGADELQFDQLFISNVELDSGTFILAVEVHQAGRDSTDLNFDMDLTAQIAPSPSPSLFAPIRSGFDFGADWKYHDEGVDLGSTWSDPSFDDTTWDEGPGSFGLNQGETTSINGGPSLGRYSTIYFRKTITIPGDATTETNWNFEFQCDDGAVIYMNGVEVGRRNMPDGDVAYDTFAIEGLGGADETAIIEVFGIPGTVAGGSLTVAVEVHQATTTSSDLFFDGKFDYSIWPTPSPVPSESSTNTATATTSVSITPTVSVSPAPSPAGSMSVTPTVSVSPVSPSSSASISFSATASASPPPPNRAFDFGQTWRYEDSGTDLSGDDWTSPSFDADPWSQGVAPLGYGDASQTTLLSSSARTVYFRMQFLKMIDGDLTYSLDGSAVFDDGYILYLNGEEVHRVNMGAPADGAVTYETLASGAVSGLAENVPVSFSVPATSLANGVNSLAVEVHQNSVSSTDLRWDLSLDVVPVLDPSATPTVSVTASPSVGAVASASPTVSVTPSSSTIVAGGCVCSCSSRACCDASIDMGFCGDDSGGLSGGAIAGIVLGVVAFFALIALLVFLVVRTRRSNDRGPPGSLPPIRTDTHSASAPVLGSPLSSPGSSDSPGGRESIHSPLLHQRDAVGGGGGGGGDMLFPPTTTAARPEESSRAGIAAASSKRMSRGDTNPSQHLSSRSVSPASAALLNSGVDKSASHGTPTFDRKIRSGRATSSSDDDDDSDSDLDVDPRLPSGFPLKSGEAKAMAAPVPVGRVVRLPSGSDSVSRRSRGSRKKRSGPRSRRGGYAAAPGGFRAEEGDNEDGGGGAESVEDEEPTPASELWDFSQQPRLSVESPLARQRELAHQQQNQLLQQQLLQQQLLNQQLQSHSAHQAAQQQAQQQAQLLGYGAVPPPTTSPYHAATAAGVAPYGAAPPMAPSSPTHAGGHPHPMGGFMSTSPAPPAYPVRATSPYGTVHAPPAGYGVPPATTSPSHFSSAGSVGGPAAAAAAAAAASAAVGHAFGGGNVFSSRGSRYHDSDYTETDDPGTTTGYDDERGPMLGPRARGRSRSRSLSRSRSRSRSRGRARPRRVSKARSVASRGSRRSVSRSRRGRSGRPSDSSAAGPLEAYVMGSNDEWDGLGRKLKNGTRRLRASSKSGRRRASRSGSRSRRGSRYTSYSEASSGLNW